MNTSTNTSSSSRPPRKVILFASELSASLRYGTDDVEFGGRLDAEILTQFVDAGGNVLVAGGNTIGGRRAIALPLRVNALF